MKRLAILSLVCVTILLALGVSLFLTSPYAQAGRGIQMFTGTFNDQKLPVDGTTKVTLVSIPFSVSATTSKLEATSLMDIYNNSYGYATCELDVDDVAFFNVTTNVPPNTANVSVGLTGVKIGIISGNHTLTVKCLGYGQYGQGSYTIHSRGTSVIITG